MLINRNVSLMGKKSCATKNSFEMKGRRVHFKTCCGQRNHAKASDLLIWIHNDLYILKVYPSKHGAKPLYKKQPLKKTIRKPLPNNISEEKLIPKKQATFRFCYIEPSNNPIKTLPNIMMKNLCAKESKPKLQSLQNTTEGLSHCNIQH